MANASILAAFERMWQHVTVALNGKSDTEHRHEVSEVDQLQDMLDSKSSSDHSHTPNDIGAMSYDNPVGTGSFSLNRDQTTAIGVNSFAACNNATASGMFSFAAGNGVVASGIGSHAEGDDTIASGDLAHAEGRSTIAIGTAQHVQGKFNIENDYCAHIVGNGSFSGSSNAHTLDWDGNAWFAGDVYVGSTSGVNKDSGSKKLVTVDEMNAAIATAIEAAFANVARAEGVEF